MRREKWRKQMGHAVSEGSVQAQGCLNYHNQLPYSISTLVLIVLLIFLASADEVPEALDFLAFCRFLFG
jgi:hypothetical protein